MLPQNLAKIAFVLHFQLNRLWQIYDKVKLEKKVANSNAKFSLKRIKFLQICRSKTAEEMVVGDPAEKPSSSKTLANLGDDFEESKNERKQHAEHNKYEEHYNYKVFGMGRISDYLLSFLNYHGGPMPRAERARQRHQQANKQQTIREGLAQIVLAGMNFCPLIIPHAIHSYKNKVNHLNLEVELLNRIRPDALILIC